MDRALLAIACFVVSVLPVSAQEMSAYPGDPLEFKQAETLVAQVKQKLPPSNARRKLILNRFEVAIHLKTELTAGSHPVVYESQKLEGEAGTYLIERKAYDKDGTAFLADKRAFDNTPVTDENRAQMEVWLKRLTDWSDRLFGWYTKLVAEEKRLKLAKENLAMRTVVLWKDWTEELARFCINAKAGIRLGEIEEKLKPLEERVARDRRALSYYSGKLPGFHSDVEKMARQAEDDRQEGREKALNLGLSLAIDSMIANSKSKEMLTRTKLRKIHEILNMTGRKPEQIKKILEGFAEGPSLVKTLRTEAQMLERLSTLVDVGGGVEEAARGKNREALAACLGLFVQTPVLKLVKANVEIYLNLIYTGLSGYEAFQRVEQFAKLSDDQLKAVHALSNTYKKHLSELFKLRKEREQILSEQGF